MPLCSSIFKDHYTDHWCCTFHWAWFFYFYFFCNYKKSKIISKKTKIQSLRKEESTFVKSWNQEMQQNGSSALASKFKAKSNTGNWSCISCYSLGLFYFVFTAKIYLALSGQSWAKKLAHSFTSLPSILLGYIALKSPDFMDISNWFFSCCSYQNYTHTIDSLSC